jgi:hypothetical protein
MPSRSPRPSSGRGCSAAEDAAMEPEIRPATEADVPLILSFIRELADYERLSHEVVATEETLRDSLFGERRFAEVLLGYGGESPAAFALFFHSFSTFLGKPGIYLEDLYVKPEFRGPGSVGPCSSTSRSSRESARLWAAGVVGPGLERAGYRVL